MTRRTALLIGGRGFIGSALTPMLVSRGFRIVCMEPAATTLGRLTPWADHVDLIQGSVADPDRVFEVAEGAQPDSIINLAFAGGVGIAEEMDVMARGCWNTLEAARVAGCSRVALASRVSRSRSVAGFARVVIPNRASRLSSSMMAAVCPTCRPWWTPTAPGLTASSTRPRAPVFALKANLKSHRVRGSALRFMRHHWR